MFYKNELSLLCDVFKKCHLSITIAEENELRERISDGGMSILPEHQQIIDAIDGTIKHGTLYKLNDAYECTYCFLLLPAEERTVMLIGPYLRATMFSQKLLEIGEKNGILPENQRYLAEYYASLPIVDDDSPLIVMLESFCEKIWHSSSYPIKNLTGGATESNTPFTKTMSNLGISDTLVNVKAIEQRYFFENELMRAVSEGNMHLESRFHSAFSNEFFEKRASDPVRNLKNYCIIMNTLLRKAAERGGVHPIYLDRVSSEFAIKIEGMSAATENFSLMSEMFRTYSQLVRKHTVKSYSAVVQQAMLIIEADLSADISLSVIAEGLDITPEYLSTVFKRETGRTISEHIRARRMEYAEHLLASTSLQVQTVALHCGIMDVQYFSKLFKRHSGKTPTEYRAQSRHSRENDGK